MLGALGRPAGHRRLDVLVEALARVRRVHGQARLVVHGRCDDPESAAARDDALGWARALGVERHVEFRGFVEDARRFEGFDLVLTAGDSFVELEAPCPVVKSGDGAELAASALRVLAGEPVPGRAPPAPQDWRALLASAVRGPVSLVPLLEEIEGWTIDYRDAGAAVSPARWKVMRHLHKFFGLKLERLFLEQVRRTARALRALGRDLDQLER